jgi:hypothetical protein
MGQKTTLAVLLSVMLVATALIVWDVAALGPADVTDLNFCPYLSAFPCPTSGGCGYLWDGTCCIPRCQNRGCFPICRNSLNPSLTP